LASSQNPKYFESSVVEHDGDLIGFAVWHIRYDFHHCFRGGCISDLYVKPEFRGKGVASRILANVAKEVSKIGGTFICGQGSDKTKKLYERVAVGFSGTIVICLERLSLFFCNLAGKSPRETIKNLPLKEWNYEAFS
jgi:GNAT superfamily N-acetyltransferase